MSKRQQVLENERKLIEKLQSNMLDELDLELDGDMPEELLEAIRNAHDETVGNGGSATNEVTTGQPYRLSDSDDFPFGTYVQNQTGRIVTKHFRISDEYQIKQTPFLAMVKDMGFNKIYVREYYGHNNYGATEVWEKRTGGSVTLK